MTTTDIARLDHNAIATLGNANDALERLGQWVTAASQAHQLVSGLVHTAFVPDSYRVKTDPRATAEEKAAAERIAVGNATAAVLQGITLGIDPLTALQQIYIVHGRPGMYAQLMVALLIAHGHEVWTEDLTDSRAVVCGRRRGSEVSERSTVTMDQAKRAGWTSNAAYGKTPQDMLYARAASRLCRKLAPEVLMGIASVEEIEDTIQATAEVGSGTRTVTPRRTTRPALAAAEVDDPPLDDEALTQAAEEDQVAEAMRQSATLPEERPEADRGPRLITAAQSRKLFAQLRNVGREDKDLALVHMAGIIGREIGSTKELTVEEAGQVIAALEVEERDLNQAAPEDVEP